MGADIAFRWELPPRRAVRSQFSLLSLLVASGVLSALLARLGGAVFLWGPLCVTFVLIMICAGTAYRHGVRVAVCEAAAFAAASTWMLIMAAFLAMSAAPLIIGFLAVVGGLKLDIAFGSVVRPVLFCAYAAITSWIVAREPWTYAPRWSCSYPWLMMLAPHGAMLQHVPFEKISASEMSTLGMWVAAVVAAFFGACLGEWAKSRVAAAR